MNDAWSYLERTTEKIEVDANLWIDIQNHMHLYDEARYQKSLLPFWKWHLRRDLQISADMHLLAVRRLIKTDIISRVKLSE